MKAYIGKSKINAAKKLPPMGIEPLVNHSDAYLIELT